MLDGWKTYLTAMAFLLTPALYVGSDVMRMFESDAPSKSVGSTHPETDFTYGEAACEQGIQVRRVIFAPDLRGELFAAEQGDEVRRRLTFIPGGAWVRHDEHYHVDFSL